MTSRNRAEAFYDCWVRKEAFIKALGGRLSSSRQHSRLAGAPPTPQHSSTCAIARRSAVVGRSLPSHRRRTSAARSPAGIRTCALNSMAPTSLTSSRRASRVPANLESDSRVRWATAIVAHRRITPARVTLD